jgi:hypothetical protein
VLLVAGIVVWMRGSSRPAVRAEWVQLTSFPDSVTQPALSPDGRMLTFIRGPGSFQTSGQIYLKLLPDGEPKQLTEDHLRKMSPVFSPDGSRIAYTEPSPQSSWDTWVVPVLGGEPRLLLPNASGLIWSARNRIVFSEIVDRLEGNHMKIVAAQESRAAPYRTAQPLSDSRAVTTLERRAMAQVQSIFLPIVLDRNPRTIGGLNLPILQFSRQA